MAVAARRKAQASPRRATIDTDESALHAGLQRLESEANPLQQLRIGDCGELLFRVVDIEAIDPLDAEVLHASVQLVHEEFRRDCVSASDEVGGVEHARVEVFLPKIRVVFVTRCGRRIIQWDVAGLSANHDLIPAHQAVTYQILQYAADDALRALTTIIDRG